MDIHTGICKWHKSIFSTFYSYIIMHESVYLCALCICEKQEAERRSLLLFTYTALLHFVTLHCPISPWGSLKFHLTVPYQISSIMRALQKNHSVVMFVVHIDFNQPQGKVSVHFTRFKGGFQGPFSLLLGFFSLNILFDSILIQLKCSTAQHR